MGQPRFGHAERDAACARRLLPIAVVAAGSWVWAWVWVASAGAPPTPADLPPPIEWNEPTTGPDGKAVARRPAGGPSADALLLELDAALASPEGASRRPLASALVRAALAIREPGLPFDVQEAPGLAEADRRLVRAFHEACRRIGRDLEDGKPAGEAMVALDEVLALATDLPALVIPRIELCTRIEGFGRYTAMPQRRFAAGTAHPILLYTELLGFTSARVTGRWRTEVASRATLLARSDGSVAWSRDWLPLRDESDRPRDDFFLAERIDLPATLPPGSYVLKSAVRDEATGRIAERSLVIEIGGTPARAAAATGD